MEVFFDTGSLFFWTGVEGWEGWPQINLLNKNQLYECTNSDKDNSSSISLDLGNISGQIWKTKFSFSKNREIKVNDFRILAINKASLIFNPPILWDGIVGLLPYL